MKKKIPLLCRIKNKLVMRGLLYRCPSAFDSCEYGFKRDEMKCEKCIKHNQIGKWLEFLT